MYTQRKRPNPPTKDFLYEEIIVKKTPIPELAERLGYAGGTSATGHIYKFLLRYGLAPNGTATDQIRRSATLSPRQLEILYGALLGDACIPPLRNRYKNHHVQVCHSKRFAEYVDWKHQELQPFSLKVFESFEKSKQVHRNMFATITHPDFNALRHLFYDEHGRKHVNRAILDLLTPLSVAVWYMDDGTYQVWHTRRGGYCRFCTNSFTYDEHLVMQSWFKERFNLDTRIYRLVQTATGNVQYSLYFDRPNSERLCGLLEPYVLPLLRYKLGALPERTFLSEGLPTSR